MLRETAQLGRGGVAQLGERLNGIQEVSGSIPLASMTWHNSWMSDASSKFRSEECHDTIVRSLCSVFV